MSEVRAADLPEGSIVTKDAVVDRLIDAGAVVLRHGFEEDQ